MKAMEKLRLKKALILTEDSEEKIVAGGKVITVRPVYKWFLAESENPV
jgi:predicted AAA+ superfamily ATPase